MMFQCDWHKHFSTKVPLAFVAIKQQLHQENTEHLQPFSYCKHSVLSNITMATDQDTYRL